MVCLECSCLVSCGTTALRTTPLMSKLGCSCALVTYYASSTHRKSSWSDSMCLSYRDVHSLSTVKCVCEESNRCPSFTAKSPSICWPSQTPFVQDSQTQDTSVQREWSVHLLTFPRMSVVSMDLMILVSAVGALIVNITVFLTNRIIQSHCHYKNDQNTLHYHRIS